MVFFPSSKNAARAAGTTSSRMRLTSAAFFPNARHSTTRPVASAKTSAKTRGSGGPNPRAASDAPAPVTSESPSAYTSKERFSDGGFSSD